MLSEAPPREVVEAFTDRCFGIGSKVVGVVVKEWLPKLGNERLIRGCLGAALMSVAVSQLRLVGMTKEQIHADVDERWDDWEPDAATENGGDPR